MNKQYQACASQNAEKAERMVKEIEHARSTEPRIRPRVSKTSTKFRPTWPSFLIASCVQPIPADPMARLDDANDQLTAINYAATTVQIAFDDFYAKLDGAQKSRFELPSR